MNKKFFNIFKITLKKINVLLIKLNFKTYFLLIISLMNFNKNTSNNSHRYDLNAYK